MVVEKRGNQYCTIHCHGEKAGTPIACFPTKEAAERQHAVIMANKIEIDLITLRKEEYTKAWKVVWAGGRAVVYFEDEADADYYINSGKNSSWFEFIHKKYVDVPKKTSGKKYRIRPKGTKITFKQTGDD